MKKVLYFDVETTGLDPKRNDIIQIAGLVEIDGEVVEEFEFKCAPFVENIEFVSQDALKVHGYSLDQIICFDTPQSVYRKLLGIFSKYVNKFDKEDKFTPAGYNVRFDMEFLKEFFSKNNDVYFGSWLNWKMVDPLPILHYLNFLGHIDLYDYKLVTICEFLGIGITAHDALSDIKATRELIQRISLIIENRVSGEFACQS